MDLGTLATVLQSSISTNPDERKAGEERLNEYQHVEGHLVGLLQIVVAANVDLSIRQVASIYLKNVSARDWMPREPGDRRKISESDKTTVRENLLEAIIQAPPIIRCILVSSTSSLAFWSLPSFVSSTILWAYSCCS
jgi:hypothetical protein